jgi:putative endonuclease
VTRTSAQQKGDDAESRAAACLLARGLVILARNARVGRGELDVVARDGEVVVFVEVRRRKTRVDALESIGPRKQGLLVRAAARWLGQHAPHARARFDVVVVVGDRIDHIIDAFRVDAG